MKKQVSRQWFRDAKYGMFIHWGVYSKLAGSYKGRELPGIGEWIMKRLDIHAAEYEAVAKEFNPAEFNAKEWVRLAKDAGMKYLVYTAKHHDGFAMYHSDCSKYNIVDFTPFGRDPVAELAEECKKADIALCFYYSQAQDWHDPDGYGGIGPIPDEEKNFRRYLDEKCKPQLRELLTKYGDIGLLWFDTPQIMTYEHSLELKEYVKSIQPDCIVSGRIGNRLGEYMSTGDNRIPLLPYDGDWEVPATLNDTWGFKANDHNWKNPADILRLMLKINGRGGNYLLNVGPDGLGRIPQPSKDILLKTGEFLKANGAAIYGTRAVYNYPYDLENILLTSRDYHLYLNISAKGHQPGLITHFTLMNTRVKKATMLATGEDIPFNHQHDKASNSNRVLLRLPAELPLEYFNTVDLELEDKTPVFESLDNL
ncbi:MAG: alpha-L-fucosidase [Defluviitaleaceae bacterium]|nr:alpha-L-fucosidase [Defluviitaleaceae bacterium]